MRWLFLLVDLNWNIARNWVARRPLQKPANAVAPQWWREGNAEAHPFQGLRNDPMKARSIIWLLLASLASFSLTWSPVEAQGQEPRQLPTVAPRQEPSRTQPERPPDRRPERPEVVREGGAWGGFGPSLDLGTLFGGGPKDPVKTLASKGPIFPLAFSMSSLSVQGFVKGAWPVVLDFEMEVGALGLLTVTSEGVEPFFYRLDGTKVGRQLTTLRLPQRFGERPRVGWYFVRVLSQGPGEVSPLYFRVFGLGAGPRAVGSVAIDQLRFQPGTIRPANREKVSFGFHARSDFNKVSAEFLRVGLFNGQVIASLVDDEEIGDVRRDESIINRSWDGKFGKVNKQFKGKPSLGQHVLQVRGWIGSKDVGDWVIAWSSELVRVVE